MSPPRRARSLNVLLTMQANAALRRVSYFRRMSSISAMAVSGMQSAAAQWQTSANTMAKAGSSGDLAEIVVQQAAAATNVSMSLQMIRADYDATQQLLDILV
jgi:hypothetical protein